MEPKYPHVHVPLAGRDGNAYSILGRVGSALKRAKVSQEEVNKFYDEARAGDYDNLLRTVVAWVSTDSEEDEDY